MAQTYNDIPAPQAILEAWQPFRELMGVTSIKTEADYERAVAIVDSLVDIVRSDEAHPLADVLRYFGDLVERYEDEHVPGLCRSLSLRSLGRKEHAPMLRKIDCVMVQVDDRQALALCFRREG